MPAQFELGGVPLLDVVRKLETTALSKNETALVLAGWLLENVGRTQRTFSYRAALANECDVQFNRVFAHQDWRDGEDVVQAEDYGDVIGFNTRFNNVGADLDTLGERLRELAQCVNELRASVGLLFEEVRLELNRLNADVFALQPDQGPTVQPGVPISPGKYLGQAKFFGQDVQLFQTPSGILSLPLVTRAMAVGGGRVERVATLARYLEEEPEVRGAFEGGPVTRGELVERFGDRTLPSGERLADVIEVLPAEAAFESPAAVIDAVADLEAGLIRAAGGIEATLAETFGVTAAVENVTAAPVASIETIPAEARAAISAAGVSTVAELATTPVAVLVERAREAGHELSVGEAAAVTARARTLRRIG
jgi:hypothetical protein